MSTTLQRPVTAEPTSPEQDGPNEKPRRQPKKKTLAGRIGRSSLMLTRQIHLYSGIFMFPWVLLYGFTGWFFNHPRMFTGDQVTTFSADTFPESTLSDLPTASMTAEQVVEEMNLASFLVSGPEVELTDERSPRFAGFLSYTVNTDEASHRVTINPVTGDGEVRTTEVKDDSEKTPLKPNPIAAITRVELPNSVATNVQKDVPDLLSQLGLPSGEAFSGRRSASLVFSTRLFNRSPSDSSGANFSATRSLILLGGRLESSRCKSCVRIVSIESGNSVDSGSSAFRVCRSQSSVPPKKSRYVSANEAQLESLAASPISESEIKCSSSFT